MWYTLITARNTNQLATHRFFFLFGRHPRLPVDLMFGTEDETNHVNHSQYVEKWRKAMTEAYKLAGTKSSEAGTRAKQRYDRLVRSSILRPGDRVLVRNLRERGKLCSHWEDQIRIVVSRKGDFPQTCLASRQVKQEEDGGRVRKAPFTLLDTVLNFTVYIFLEARIKSKYIGTSLDSTN